MDDYILLFQEYGEEGFWRCPAYEVHTYQKVKWGKYSKSSNTEKNKL